MGALVDLRDLVELGGLAGGLDQIGRLVLQPLLLQRLAHPRWARRVVRERLDHPLGEAFELAPILACGGLVHGGDQGLGGKLS